MTVRLIFKVMLCLALMAQVSCKEDKEVGLYSIYQLDKYKNRPSLIELDTLQWELQKGLMSSFPDGIQAYRKATSLSGRGDNISLLVFNPKMNIELKPVLSAVAKTPSDFFIEEVGEVYACLNGGYFSGTSSLSLVMYNGEVLSPNIRSFNRQYEGRNTPYYATRAAFGLSSTNIPSVGWVYNVGNNAAGLYIYPKVSPNKEGEAPQLVPSADFPEGGAVWGVRNAIGGSPMLIKDSVINITDEEEMVTTSATSNSPRPRSAIGYLKNGNIVMLAVQGGTTEIPGMTLNELATEMLAIGCVGAINLDGGGSTSFVIDGQKTVVPSNASNAERGVISALIVKKR